MSFVPFSHICLRYLTAYYVLLMLCVSGTIYASAFCFLFAGKAAEYVDKYYECIRAITGDRFGALMKACCRAYSWPLILSF